MLPFPVDRVPAPRGACRPRGRGGARTRELVPRSGHNHHLVLRIAADISKGEGKLAMRQQAPPQGTAIGVKGYLENTIAPFHADGLIFRGVFGKASHVRTPLCPFPYSEHARVVKHERWHYRQR